MRRREPVRRESPSSSPSKGGAHIVTAVLALFSSAGAPLAALPAASPGDGSEDTVFTTLRAIQATYSPQGGDAYLEWKVKGEKFTWIRVSLDGGEPDLFWGTTPGIKIQALALGYHEFTVEGISARGRFSRTTDLIIVGECPLPGLNVDCLFYGYEPQGGRGFLQVSWHVPDRPADDPYVDFEIVLQNEADGEFHWLTEAPDNAVTFSNIREGEIQVWVIASTWSYLAPAVPKTFRAVGVLPPRNVWLHTSCIDGQGVGTIRYEVPAEAPFDFVAVWWTSDEGRRWGYFKSNPPLVRLVGLAEKDVEVEVAGALLDQDEEMAVGLSNLPGRPGPHVVVRSWINCAGRVEFIRGDADADGKTDISDAVRVLSFLFFDSTSLPCPPSGDVDDNGVLEITDPVRLLTFLFADGEPLPLPGPAACAEDPTPDWSAACSYNSCGAVSP